MNEKFEILSIIILVISPIFMHLIFRQEYKNNLRKNFMNFLKWTILKLFKTLEFLSVYSTDLTGTLEKDLNNKNKK